MKFMHNLSRSITLLICLTVLFASFVGAQEKSSGSLSVVKSNSEMVLLTEGVGVENIVIDKSRADDVIKTFGKKFSLIKHGEHSSEMYYKKSCLSFYYMQNDKEKTIFDVTATLPCERNIATSKGIILGYSSLQEVVRIYGGNPEPLTTTETRIWFYEYLGVTFSTKFDSWEEAQEDESFQRKIVSEISITNENVKKEEKQDNSEDEDQ